MWEYSDRLPSLMACACALCILLLCPVAATPIFYKKSPTRPPVEVINYNGSLQCYECDYSVNHNRTQGHLECLDQYWIHGLNDTRVRQVNCAPNAYCQKSWMYLGENDYSVSRRCKSECQESDLDGPTYFTLCCRDELLCNGGDSPSLGGWALPLGEVVIVVVVTRLMWWAHSEDWSP